MNERHPPYAQRKNAEELSSQDESVEAKIVLAPPCSPSIIQDKQPRSGLRASYRLLSWIYIDANPIQSCLN